MAFPLLFQRKRNDGDIGVLDLSRRSHAGDAVAETLA